ncbi:MAG: DeoR/GlpR family DNA-binding transcription regulator [Akkermansiaceae bacterium]|nr:DeoR/GlpR family DNA-binding transcription regulator [Akkermansiaceae bacterium]
MLAIERHRQILELLSEGGSVRTAEISERFGVTDETVRKDFELLERRGELRRIHGGASKLERVRPDLSFHERQAVMRAEKQAIARLAASRIQPGEIIFLDASSTALTLTEYLPEVPLTILTNALNVFDALANRPNLDLMCTGGLYDARSRSFIGLTAERSLKSFNVHRMFLSGSGLDVGRGVSESNARQAAFKERVVAHAEDVVFMADHSKLGRKASFFFAETSDLSCVITDAAVDPELRGEIESSGLEVLVA